MVGKNFFKEVYNLHVKSLKNLNVTHNKLLICFSAIPGSGKTYISKILEKKFSAVRINNDEIRIMMKKVDITTDLDKDLNNYLYWFMRNYNFPNKLIILDSGIDRRYNEIFEFAKENHFNIFIIRIKVSRKILDERVFKRNHGIDIHYKNEIERWVKEWKDFGKKINSDVIIKNEENLDLEKIFDKIFRYLN